MKRLALLVTLVGVVTAETCVGEITGPCPPTCPALDSALVKAHTQPFPNTVCCPLVAPDTGKHP